MNILTDKARTAVFRDGEIIITMQSGTEIRLAVADNPRLARGTAEQLNKSNFPRLACIGPILTKTSHSAVC